MNRNAKEQCEARDQLRVLLAPGDTVYVVERARSYSGLSHRLDLYLLAAGAPVYLTALAARAIGLSLPVHGAGLRVSGGGMDMASHVVYELGTALWANGFGCLGYSPDRRCPSNDHNNSDRDCAPHSPTHSHWHRGGGYALRSRWI